MINFKEYKGYAITIDDNGIFIAAKINANEFIMDDVYKSLEAKIDKATRKMWVPVKDILEIIVLKEFPISELSDADKVYAMESNSDTAKFVIDINQKQFDAIISLGKTNEEIIRELHLPDDYVIGEER